MDTTLPVAEKRKIDELRQANAELNTRLTAVENKLSKATIEHTKSYRTEEQPRGYKLHEEKVLSDIELSELLKVSNILIRDYRVKGKKPRGAFLFLALTEEWEIKGDGWVRKK